jgi:uncharacterized protein involved in exopolysaccharide biosynthesis
MNAPIDKTSTNPRLSQAGLTPAAPMPAVGARPPAAPGPAGPVRELPQGAPDVGAMIRRVFAHWQVVIVTLIIGGLVTMQIVRTRVPSFKSETVIFYREGIGKSITGPTESPEQLRSLGTKLKETLLAQQTLRRIIDEFHLYPDVVQKSGYADAVDQMRKKTDFKSRSQDTFAISFEGTTKEEAQRVCARMADILVSENAKRLSDDMRSTLEFLDVEKKRADEELERAERDVTEFLNQNPEFAGAKGDLATEVLAQQRRIEKEQKARKSAAAKAGGRGGRGARQQAQAAAPQQPNAPAAPAVDPVLITARTQAMNELINAKKDLSDKLLKFTDQHPDVRGAQARVAAAEASVQRAEEAIATAMPKEDAPAPRKVANVEDPYGGDKDKPEGSAKPAATMTPEEAEKEAERRKPIVAAPQEKVVNVEMEWSRLQRALGKARGHQKEMEEKLYRQELIASTAESGYGTTIAVLDPAYKPSAPSNAPNKTVVMIGLAASVAVGLVLSAAWGLFLDDRVFSPNEIESIVMVPVLGFVPKGDEKKKKGKKDKDPPKPGKGDDKAAKTAAAKPAAGKGATRG